MESGENLLVVTDGNNNRGKLLGDVMLFASSINASVSTLNNNPINSDVSVMVRGQHEIIRDSESEFIIDVNVVGSDLPYRLQVLVDDEIVLEKQGSKSDQILMDRKFSEGEYHKIEARLLDVDQNDYFKNNNQYFKSIKVVPRPKILYVSQKGSPLANNLDKIYEVERRSALPDDLTEYMAVVLNNIPANMLLPRFDMINEYVVDGNGLIVIGGENSYESGGYKGTLMETLLPVKIGAGEDEEKSDVNIAIVIDISSGTEDYIAVEKALALSVLDSLNEKNNVGVVAFGHHPCKAFKVAEIRPLKDHKEELIQKITSLRFDGQSCFDLGVQGGFDLLSDVGGGKNILFISDGKAGGNEKLREDTISDVRQVNARGVKVYTIGVGTESDQSALDNILFLSNMAVIGEGIFFKVDASNRLKVLFGDPASSKEEKEFFNSLIVLDTTHFITEGLGIGATVGGYNYVVPKPSSRILVTTNKNIPMLTVWRFGLGRVVSLATDDGSAWGGELLNQKNSKLITRSINWAIGDLSRKQSFDITIKDTTMGQKGYVNVVAGEVPESEGLSFAKVDTNYYTADFRPDGAGFKDIMGAKFAVNYEEEFGELGTSAEFLDLVVKTGGEVFDQADLDGIIEFVKKKSKRIKINSIDYKWPFIITALLLFLSDIVYRRLNQNKREQYVKYKKRCKYWIVDTHSSYFDNVFCIYSLLSNYF
jgi:uncharacterized membrane protein